MPNVTVYDINGGSVGTIQLSDEVFAKAVNPAVLHSAVKMYLANQRQGTQSTLTRAEVRGGGRKPWRQKGTGRARQGSIRSPQWIKGGIAFGPKPREHRLYMNKTTRRIALKGALTAKVNDGEIAVLRDLSLAEYKTKSVVNMLKALGSGKKALIVMDEYNEKIIKSAANIPGVKTTAYNNLNVYDILNCDKFIVLEKAVPKIEEVYA